SLRGHKVAGGTRYGAAISANGRRIVSASADGVKVWDIPTAPDKYTLKLGDGKGVRLVGLALSGRRVVFGSTNSKVVHVVDAATGKESLNLQMPSAGPTGVAFSADGQRLACFSGATGGLIIWDVSMPTEMRTFEAHQSKNVLRSTLAFTA